MNTLPKIGRPNKSGVSFKDPDAVREYRRQKERNHPRKTARRWWSGLSRKMMGDTDYKRAYRMLKQEATRFLFTMRLVPETTRNWRNEG